MWIRRTVAGVTAALMLACGESGMAPLEEDAEEERWEAFTLSGLKAGLPTQGVRFATGVESSSFRAGLLRAPVGEQWGPAVNRVNAVYVVSSGAAALTTENGEWELAEGAVAFVRGDVEHRIVDVTSALELVVAYRRETLATNVDPAVVVLPPEDLTLDRDPELSTWRPLLTTSNVGVGVYTVAKGLGPDVLLTHTVDELKIVVSGEARFDIGSGGVQAGPGSVAYIENRVPHRFRRVAETLEVLVILER